MKRTALIIFALMLAIALCACDPNSTNNDGETSKINPANEPASIGSHNTEPANVDNQDIDDGRGDIFDDDDRSDPGDMGEEDNEDALEWRGDYTAESSAYVITICDFDGTGFDFEAYKIDEPVSLVAGGYAKLYPDNVLMAEYGQLSFSMHEDHWTLDVFTPEGHDLSGLSGSYIKNDYSILSGLYSDESGHVLLAVRSYNASEGAIQFAITPVVEGYDPEYGVAWENPDNPGQAEGDGYTFRFIDNDTLLASDDTIIVSGSALGDSFTRSGTSTYDWSYWRDYGLDE